MMKLATVGTSAITDRFIQGLKTEGSFSLNAVYSRSLEQGKLLADKYGADKVITDWQALLSDPEIEVVYVASPNDLHFPQSAELLNAGKHVICEKPFVSNLRQFEALMALVEKTQRFCFDATTLMHLPNLQVLRDHLELIGPIKILNSSFIQYSSRYDLLLKGQMTNIFDLNHSGGALMDLGIYPLTLTMALLGKPESVHYHCNKYQNGIDLSGVLTLTYPNTVASLVFAKDSVGQSGTVIAGEKGALIIPEQPSRLVQVTKVSGLTSENLGLSQDGNPMVHEIRDFAEAITTQDWEHYRGWMDVTRLSLWVMDEARRQNGIIFPADTAEA